MNKEKLQLINELHKPARKNFPRRRVLVKNLFDLYQADLVDLQKYSTFNRNYKYILTVINVLSKYAFAEPVLTKSAKHVTSAFEKIIKFKAPKNLQTDDGKEFFNKDFKALMEKYKINHYSTYSVMKASVVERFNRTLKELMWKQFSLQGTYKWLNILPILVKNYNNKKHRTIGMKPVEVNEKKLKCY